jgi:aromatic ring-opening dioxygenase LigB subunit
MLAVRAKAAALAPDTIVLLSPHAPMALHQMGVSLASSYRGSLAFFSAPNVRVEVTGDQAMGEAIMESAAKRGVPALITASHGEIVDLDHGAMVPLVYLLGGLAEPCQLVLLAFSQLSAEEHRRFGDAVGWALLEASKRVVYVASGDLSHRLVPGAPVGFDPRGVQFDGAVVDNFGAGDWDALLSIPAGLAAAAGECGFRSLAVLAGVVAAAEASGLKTRNHVFSYEGPFGVGYLVGEVEVMDAPQAQGTAK